MTKLLKVQAFAALTGVTVRTLHHYDRIGLLCPERSVSGYRLYGTRELERLEQIVALRFIGVPLSEIHRLLEGCELADALPRQRVALQEKQRVLGDAIRAIQAAERTLQEGQQLETAVLTKIIEVMDMQKESKWIEKYYSPEALEALGERQPDLTPARQAQVEREWRELFRDVEAALDEDPSSDRAQALGQRWKTLVGEFTGANPEIAEGLDRAYADRANWPASAKQQNEDFADPRIWAFMSKVFGSK